MRGHAIVGVLPSASPAPRAPPPSLCSVSSESFSQRETTRTTVVTHHSASLRPRLKSSILEFSRSVFAVWWISLGLVHCLALGYHARITKFYWRLPGSPIGEMIELYDLSLPHTYCRSVSMVNAAIAVVHGIAVLRMIRNSARARQLVFYVEKRPAPTSVSESKSSRKLDAAPRPRASCIRRLVHSIRGLFAYKGPLGVEGKYFDLVLYAAELVETLLQTYQAFRVNSLVARRWLSRLYVGVLVFNCWCIPLIHVVYKTRIAHKRLLSLMCDCVLDLVSAVVVPGALFVVYLLDYNAERHAIERTRWYDDRWLVQLWSEHDLVVIASWIDAFSRVLFAIGLLLSMEGVKQILRVEPVNTQTRPVRLRRLTRQFLELLVGYRPPDAHQYVATTHRCRRLTPLLRQGTKHLVHQLQRVRWAAIFHAGLALWGVVVLCIHAGAEIRQASTPLLPVCPIQFTKWVYHAPVCLLLDINCAALDIDGRASEIERYWQHLDATRVLRLVIRHCPQLEMPPSLGIFRNLKSVKLYNTTLLSWNASDSFSDKWMPQFRSLQFIRVHFHDAVLPPGLLDTNFPSGVRNIEVCSTNLHELPPDLGQTWPTGLRLSLESSGFTEIPPVALRLAPWQLSVAGNPIQDAPLELFTSPGIHRIGLAHTQITALPTNLSSMAVPSTLRQVSVAHTRVNEPLPQWVQAVVRKAQRIPYLVVAVFAGGTLHCGTQDSGAHDGRVATLARCISCDPTQDEIAYPLAFEDQQNQL